MTAWGLLATESSLNCEHWVPVKDAGSKIKGRLLRNSSKGYSLTCTHKERGRGRERREGKQEGEVG